MDKSLKNRVSAHRRRLENPYAHVEYLDGFEAETSTEQITKLLNNRISKSRKLLENQYAYLNEFGGYSADVNRRNNPSPQPQPQDTINSTNDVGAPRRYTNLQIESLVKDLHARLWKERESLWNGTPPSDPIALLDPATALRLIGYEFSTQAGLGQYRAESGQVEIAGLIDRTSMQVHISQQFPKDFQTFTAAHELGHAMLHAGGGNIHRDRPLDGTSLSRNQAEWEADRFATLFLMPEKLVRARFTNLFKTECFVLTEETAIALVNRPLHEVQGKFSNRRALARELANSERFDGRRFVSLAKQFGVSSKAMAIRLEELKLLA